MKDFDELRAAREAADRDFRLGGQEFRFRAYVYPGHLVAIQEAGTDEEFWRAVDDLIPKQLLEPGQEKKWAQVRSPKAEKPLSLWDVVELMNHIQAVASGRPTVRSGDSSASPGRNGTASTVTSPSEVSTPVVTTSVGS